MKIQTTHQHYVVLEEADLREVLDGPTPDVKKRYSSQVVFAPDQVHLEWSATGDGEWTFNSSTVYGRRRLTKGNLGKDTYRQTYDTWDRSRDWPDFLKVLISHFQPGPRA